MFRILLGYVNECQEKDKQGKWIGNERLAEMEYDFDKLLAKIIDQRIEIKTSKSN